MAHRDESDSRLACLKSGDNRTLAGSASDANDPEPTWASQAYRSANRTTSLFCWSQFPVLMA
jgi:hypothetical protein